MKFFLKRFVQMVAKRLEIRITIWRNKRKIEQAYRTQEDVDRVRNRWRAVVLVAGAALIGALASGAVWHARVPIRQALSNLSQRLTLPERSQRTARVSLSESERREKPAREFSRTPRTTSVDSVLSVTPPAGKRAEPVSRSPQSDAPEGLRYCIVVNKAGPELFLLERAAGDWAVRRSFRIAIGANNGPKQRAGDKRTPEGQYFIIGRKERSELSTIYGPLSYVLDYPNAQDLAAGRTGTGIWIHGTAPDSIPVDTRGCLELSNSDLSELSTFLKMGIGTPVMIVNDPALGSPQDAIDWGALAGRYREVMAAYEGRRALFGDLVEAWRSAWERCDLESYSEFYSSTDFFSQGMRWPEWRARKQRIFESGISIRLMLDSLILSDFSESTAVVRLLQDYRTSTLVSVGGKQLSYKKEQGAWKIVRESTFPKEELSL